MSEANIVNSIRSVDEICGKIKKEFEKYKYITVKIVHQKRSIISNSLQYHWYMELEQQGDQTAAQYRNYCKYHFGLALRAANDEDFAAVIGDVLRKYNYEDRIKLMSFIDVTSIFDRPTMKSYLIAVKDHYTPQGYILTSKDDL